jgi:uncharacterized membrane protein YesL
MNRLFNPDNPVMQFLARIFDLFALNLFFLISCIPLVTIGASLSALYYVSLKLLRGEEPYIWKNFRKAFLENFKQSTLIWLGFVLAAALLAADFAILNTQDTDLFLVVRVILWVICGILLSIFIYVFPVISHFVCTTRQAVKNAAFMAIGHLPYTLILLAVFALIFYLCTISSTLFAGVLLVAGLCGFSTVAFCYCIIFDRIFKKYEIE